MKKEVLYRIELSKAVFGIIVQNNKIIKTAPIGKWMIGKNISFIKSWVERKNGNIQNLNSLF